MRLALIGSTRVGGRYEDGTELATPELLDAVDAVAADMSQFHVGRFDVRFSGCSRTAWRRCGGRENSPLAKPCE